MWLSTGYHVVGKLNCRPLVVELEAQFMLEIKLWLMDANYSRPLVVAGHALRPPSPPINHHEAYFIYFFLKRGDFGVVLLHRYRNCFRQMLLAFEVGEKRGEWNGGRIGRKKNGLKLEFSGVVGYGQIACLSAVITGHEFLLYATCPMLHSSPSTHSTIHTPLSIPLHASGSPVSLENCIPRIYLGNKRTGEHIP